MQTSTVAAIVVTYNRLEKLRATIDRLCEIDNNFLQHIIIVNNASTDSTDSWLSQLDDPRINVLSLPRNEGGAGGFENGLRYANHVFNPDWYLVMDDDARPSENLLSKFHAEDRQIYDVWAAAVFYPYDTPDQRQLCEMNRPWRNPFWNATTFLKTLLHGRNGFHIQAIEYTSDVPAPIDGGSFVGLFLGKRAIDLAGFPDGRLFIYGDDVLYTLEISRQGGKIAFDPNLIFEHDCATYSNDKIRAFTPLWKVYYAYRNGIIFYQKASGLFFPVILPIVIAKWLYKAGWYRGHYRTYFKLMRKAAWHGLTRNLDVPHETVRSWADDTNSPKLKTDN